MTTTTVQIQGLKELAHALRELPQAIGRKHLKRCTSDGAAVIRDEARLRAPLYHGDVQQGHPPPGTLKKAIRIARIAGSGTDAIYAVWVRHGKRYRKTGKKQTNQDAFYWTWVEFGSIHNPLSPTQHAFMRPAFEAKKGVALDMIIHELRSAVDLEAGLLAWK